MKPLELGLSVWWVTCETPGSPTSRRESLAIAALSIRDAVEAAEEATGQTVTKVEGNADFDKGAPLVFSAKVARAVVDELHRRGDFIVSTPYPADVR